MKLKSYLGNWITARAEESEAICRNSTLVLCQEIGSVTKILDCGCADGQFTFRVAEATMASLTLGIDVVAELVSVTRARGIEGVLGDLDRGLPVADDSVDLVMASHIIEHVSDTDSFVKEIYRVLKPGGYFIVATPNLAALANIVFLVLGKQPPTVEVSDVALVGTWSARGSRVNRKGPAHRRIFTRAALKGLLEWYGFHCERMVGSGFLPLPTTLGAVGSKIFPVYSSNTIIRAYKAKEAT